MEQSQTISKLRLLSMYKLLVILFVVFYSCTNYKNTAHLSGNYIVDKEKQQQIYAIKLGDKPPYFSQKIEGAHIATWVNDSCVIAVKKDVKKNDWIFVKYYPNIDSTEILSFIKLSDVDFKLSNIEILQYNKLDNKLGIIYSEIKHTHTHYRVKIYSMSEMELFSEATFLKSDKKKFKGFNEFCFSSNYRNIVFNIQGSRKDLLVDDDTPNINNKEYIDDDTYIDNLFNQDYVDTYIYNIDNKEYVDTLKGARLACFSPINSNIICFVEVNGGMNFYDVNSKVVESIIHFKKNYKVDLIHWSVNGKYIWVKITSNGLRHIVKEYLYDIEKKRYRRIRKNRLGFDNDKIISWN